MELKTEEKKNLFFQQQSLSSQTSAPEIKYVIFDIGGVLLNFKPREVIAEAFPNQDVDQVLHRTYRSPDWNTFDKGDISEVELIEKIAKRIGVDLEQVAQFMELTKKAWLPNLETIELIQELHGQGIRLYALTNMPASLQRYFEERYSFWNYFDSIFVSAELHMVKPEKEIYAYFLQQTGINAAEAVFIDDRKENLITAEEFGINIIEFQHAEACRQSLHNDFYLKTNRLSVSP
jgi:putative hydrolase of the HAD superfamily